MQPRLHLTLSLLITLLLASCVPLSMPAEPSPFATRQAPWDCAEVSDTRLESFPFDIGAEAARAWVQTQYKLSAADVRFDLSADGNQSMLHWTQPTKLTYSVVLWNDARESARVSVIWSEQAPTLVDVLRCLGDPPLYRAYHAMTPGGLWTYLEFWYPERGITIGSHITRKAFGMSVSQAIADVSYVQPGLPEDLITRLAWSVTRGSDRYAEILKGLKPWPGDITKITIDKRG